MEWLSEFLAIAGDLWSFVGPVLPYAIISVLTYQIMSRFVKPLIVQHKNAEGGFDSNLWRNIRRGMVFYPMLLGLLMALPFGLNIGYAVGAAATSQIWYLILRKILESRGIELPDDEGLSVVPPEPED